jgi:amino acid permease
MSSYGLFVIAMDISVFIICTLALIMGYTGYFMFDSAPAEYVMQNLPLGTVFSGIVRGFVALIMILTVPITVFAACEVIEHYIRVFSPKKIRRYVDTNQRFLARILFRTPFVLLAILLAWLVPSFTKVVGLVGAICDSCLGLVFPTLLGTRLLWSKLRWYQYFLHVFIVLFGLYGVACGIMVFALT